MLTRRAKHRQSLITVLVVGDTRSTIADAKGGNDTVVADACGTFSTTVSAFGDVAGDTSGNQMGCLPRG
jgi:hypothetical protein